MQTQEQREYVDTLRLMLAELMVKQSRVDRSTYQREMSKKGIKALQAAVDALQTQVYA